MVNTQTCVNQSDDEDVRLDVACSVTVDVESRVVGSLRDRFVPFIPIAHMC